MGVKVAVNSLHWSPQPSVPHTPSSSQALASAISSPSSKRRSFSDGALFCRYTEMSSSSLYSGGYHSSRLYRSRSCENLRSRVRTIRRTWTVASLASFSDDEFSKQIQELALRFQLSEDGADDHHGSTRSNDFFEERLENGESKLLEHTYKAFDGLEPPEFPERDDINIIAAYIERKANSVEIPLSLRIIKKKKQWQEGLVEAGESAYSSVKKAFSSMVFIIRELHSFSLQMREVLFYEDLQGILANVHKEMHASFVWLFEKVFSQTPTLMVYVMILLANYSVYSISSNVAIAASPPQVYEEVSVMEDRSILERKFDSSITKTFKLSSSSESGGTTSVGGNNNGGGKYKQVASGTDDDGRFNESSYHSTVTPDEGLSSTLRTNGEESVSMQISHDEEVSLWNSMVEEASRMQGDEPFDHETMHTFVSPVDGKINSDDHSDYFRTELLYQTGLAQEPNNPLLLANYAQFLYLVARDFDRAEDYFKRAAKVEPKDAEALNKYANFLWVVRKDLWAAEETYLEAIDVEPHNSYYAANYAHFLWNTGGEDTCFPLDSSPDSTIDE